MITVWWVGFLFVINSLRIRNVIEIYSERRRWIIKTWIFIFFHFFQEFFLLIVFVSQIFQPCVIRFVVRFEVICFQNFWTSILKFRWIFNHFSITNFIVLLFIPTSSVSSPIIISSLVWEWNFLITTSLVSKVMVSSTPWCCLGWLRHIHIRLVQKSLSIPKFHLEVVIKTTISTGTKGFKSIPSFVVSIHIPIKFTFRCPWSSTWTPIICLRRHPWLAVIFPPTNSVIWLILPFQRNQSTLILFLLSWSPPCEIFRSHWRLFNPFYRRWRTASTVVSNINFSLSTLTYILICDSILSTNGVVRITITLKSC